MSRQVVDLVRAEATEALGATQASERLRGGDASEAARSRILAATLRCVSRVGLAKTTLDDVAREAGCGRATVYRYFPNKGALFSAAVEAEGARIAAAIVAAGDEHDDLAGALVAMMHTAARELVEHPALGFVLEHEPERVLPFLAFDGGSRLLTDAGTAFGPALARFLPAGHAERAAEWCARVLLAHLAPHGATRPAVPSLSELRPLVEHFVLPGLTGASQPPVPTFAKG